MLDMRPSFLGIRILARSGPTGRLYRESSRGVKPRLPNPSGLPNPGQKESGSQRRSRPFLWSEEKLPDYFCDSSRRTYWARSKANGSAACFWLSLPRKSATEA